MLFPLDLVRPVWWKGCRPGAQFQECWAKREEEEEEGEAGKAKYLEIIHEKAGE